jgi:hypothetical protein
MLARIDVSLRLKRTPVMSSVDVGRVRFDIGALLEMGVFMVDGCKNGSFLTLSHPKLGRDLKP